MITNEARYLTKIITGKEEEALERGITGSIILIWNALFMMVGSLTAICVCIVLLLVNQAFSMYFGAAFSIAIILFLVSVFFIYLMDRDVIGSKNLNEKLYIYFDLLGRYVSKDKKTVQIVEVRRRIRKYLNELEKNLNNLFIFYSLKMDVHIVSDIRELLNKRLFLILDSGNKAAIIELVQKVKELHLLAESIHLAGHEHVVESQEHADKIDALKKCLEQCNSIQNDTQKSKRDILENLTSRNFLIITFVVLGAIVLILVNREGVLTVASANISVLAFFTSVILFIVQIKRK